MRETIVFSCLKPHSSHSAKLCSGLSSSVLKAQHSHKRHCSDTLPMPVASALARQHERMQRESSGAGILRISRPGGQGSVGVDACHASESSGERRNGGLTFWHVPMVPPIWRNRVIRGYSGSIGMGGILARAAARKPMNCKNAKC